MVKYTMNTHCKHGHEYTPDNTYVHSNGYSCKTCRRISAKRFRDSDPEKYRITRRAARYGITVDELRALLEAGCVICGGHEKLHVDHNHATGKVRGSLCHYCNTAIGLLKEDRELIHKALTYLEES